MHIENRQFDEERALYGLKDLHVNACTFAGPADGESALKECSEIEVTNCLFELRYPFWHVYDGKIENCELTTGCRAALWYDKYVSLKNCKMNGIKALRECDFITIDHCEINSEEFAWKVRTLELRASSLVSQYPFFECSHLRMEHLNMTGKYSFQYVEDAVIRNSVLKTKDAFWHAKDITCENCVLEGEYLAWYSENLRLINCTIQGTQPFCYCKNLYLENCKMIDTDLSFEKSDVRATVLGHIDSVKNPLSGFVRADSIGEIIMEPAFAGKCEIKTGL